MLWIPKLPFDNIILINCFLIRDKVDMLSRIIAMFTRKRTLTGTITRGPNNRKISTIRSFFGCRDLV